MSTPILLGIDVGTSSVKVVATDVAGRLLAHRSSAYLTKVASNDSGAEQDAESWWRALISICGDVVGGRPVLGVAVTCQAPTLVAVDAAGAALGPALTWLDRRAADDAHRIAELAPDGRNGADPFFGTSKLPWLRRERPDSFARATKILSANGFIVRRLAGVDSLDVTTASLMQGFDERTGQFDERLHRADIGIDLLAKIHGAQDIVGVVTDDAARHTGIPAGTPVAAGGIDAIGSALEAAALTPGDPMVDMTGFSSVTILPVPSGTAVDGFIHSRHCVDGVDLLITAQVTAGATVDWINNLIPGTDLRDSEHLLARSRPSRLTMMPSLSGERTPRWNINARGIIDGIDLATDGYDLMLAALEGNALSLATDLQVMHDSGYTVDRIRSTGGGSASSAWLQIKADVLGVVIDRPASGHGAAQGASYLAGLATGTYESIDTIRRFTADVQATYVPDLELHRRYSEKLTWFAELIGLNAIRRKITP